MPPEVALARPASARRAWENMAWKMWGAASCAVSRRGCFASEVSTRTRRTTTRTGMSMDVTNRGTASRHHRSETKASSAAQLRFSGELNVGSAAGRAAPSARGRLQGRELPAWLLLQHRKCAAVRSKVRQQVWSLPLLLPLWPPDPQSQGAPGEPAPGSWAGRRGRLTQQQRKDSQGKADFEGLPQQAPQAPAALLLDVHVAGAPLLFHHLPHAHSSGACNASVPVQPLALLCVQCTGLCRGLPGANLRRLLEGSRIAQLRRVLGCWG